MRPRMALRLSISLVLAALAACCCVAAAGAAAPAPRPRVFASLPAVVAAHARPRLTIVVRDSPASGRVLVQERTRGRWATRGRVRVTGDRRLTVFWRGLRGRDAVGLRVVLVGRAGRVLDVGDARRVRRRPVVKRPPPPVPGAPQPAPSPPAPPPQPPTPPGPPQSPTPPDPDPPAPLPGGPLVLASEAQRLHSLGADRWDVWTCGDVGGGTAAEAVATLDAEVVPFYAWLSGGLYRPEFRARGALAGADVADCESEALQASAGRDGALIVQTTRISAGADACVTDYSRLDPCAGEPTVLPGSERLAWLSPANVFGPGAHVATAVHELGHALTWPHSFTGRLYVEYQGAETAIEYDDPFDVMGYERLWGTGSWTDASIGTFAPKATQAFDRIAVGWVPDTAMTVHAAAQASYAIGPLSERGLQVVIVPTADPRAFLTLEARVQQPFDPVPGEGVVVHAVDQRPAACDLDGDVAGCWADEVRVSPAPNAPDTLDSLVAVGEGVDVAGVRIAVTGRVGNRFAVTVDGARAGFALNPTVCLYVPAQCAGGAQGPL